ncbi:hypothetical protein [Novosphingopyxis sp.]|uniref:hypothetical protein n=1 Tax=Novosphingopyxis sp. TaxID=2709690 RepID=UPI003B5A5BF3
MSKRSKTTGYAADRNTSLPWGYWLMLDDHGDDRIIDEDGRRWRSVRENLWLSRLGMPRLNSSAQEEALEFLLTVLAVIDRRIIKVEELVIDLFEANWHVADHYGQWLIAQQLIEHDMEGSPTGPLTDEGKAVLAMLASTRSPEHAPIPIGMNWVKVRRGLDRGTASDGLRQLLTEQEALADRLPYRFVRKTIVDGPGIVLVGDALGPTMPLRRTIWSMTFPDGHARDRFYLWLHERLDRWEAWGEMTEHEGGRVLSERLLQLAFADRLIEIT